MAKYHVKLSAKMYMLAGITVEAGSEDDAELKALKQAYDEPGTVNWEPATDYPELESIQIDEIETI